MPALDGFRGLMTILVVLSHYFAEIRGGDSRLGVGYIAVDGFFVLSGLLVGRLILDKRHATNFFKVFYIRRICRTFPTYFVCLAAALGLGAALSLPKSSSVPDWSYVVFANNLFMAAHQAIGTEWLGPTWTMAVEEQFYLVVPAMLLVVPRRYLMAELIGVIAVACIVRAVCVCVNHNDIAAVVLLPARADNLAIGLGCAVLLNMEIDWTRPHLRAAPIFIGLLVAGGRLLLGPQFLPLVGHTLLCMALAIFLMTLVCGAPEAKRFESPRLIFFGETSYATYLTHMPVLWVAHWLIRGREPTLQTVDGVVVTLACLPLVVFVGYVLTRWFEQPISAVGRRLHWRFEPAAAPAFRAGTVRPDVLLPTA